MLWINLSMKFYTNVTKYKNKMLVRGYQNGIPFSKEVNYKPYLFVTTNKNTEYRTLNGKGVEKLEFKSLSVAREFVKQYENVPNFEIYGMDKFVYPFIYDYFPGEIKYDPSVIRVFNLDIEVASDKGFPDVALANNPITLIGIGIGKERFIFGMGDYEAKSPHHHFMKCRDERHLLIEFALFWSKCYPDVITGWNCLPTDTSIWLKNKIISLKDIEKNDILYNSVVKDISPISKKEVWKINLCNGGSLIASKDHKIPVLIYSNNKYTNFSQRKQKQLICDMSVEEISNITDKSLFVEIPIRKNENSDVLLYTNDQLYLAGLIFTDGSIKNKWSYNFYQSDLDLMNEVCKITKGNIYTSRQKTETQKEQFSTIVNKKVLGDANDLIYMDNKKCLNLTELSKLSYQQFTWFLAGLLDGDGSISHGSYVISNVTDNLDKIEQLLYWNGFFVTKSKFVLRFVTYNLPLKKKIRWDGKNVSSKLQRTSSQRAKQIKYKKIGDKWYVRIKNVKKTNKKIDMMDIETDTHYFVANSIRVHNCAQFDIPYIINRMKKILDQENDISPNILSPWRYIQEKIIEFHGKETQTYVISGISTLDYLDLYKKFTYNQLESYTLDHVAFVEVGRRKLDYSEYESLNELYVKNYQKFVDYNITDIDRVADIDEKNKFLELIYAMAFDAKINFNDSLTSVLLWDVISHNYLMDRKIVIPPMKMKDYEELPGAYVKAPIIGMHDWVVSFDLTSLYPHLIMGYNISPETLVNKIPNMNAEYYLNNTTNQTKYTQAANGCQYRKDIRGFLPELMKLQFDKRVEYKNKMLESQSILEDIEKELIRRDKI